MIYAPPGGIFSDPDGDSLKYTSASLSDDSDIPSWLTFFSGIENFAMFMANPVPDEAESMDLKVTGEDAASNTFSFEVNFVVNKKIQLDSQVIPDDVIAFKSEELNFPFDMTTLINDPESQALIYVLTSGPTWLSITSVDNTVTFSGTPGIADMGRHAFEISVSDGVTPSVVISGFVNVIECHSTCATCSGEASN